MPTLTPAQLEPCLTEQQRGALAALRSKAFPVMSRENASGFWVWSAPDEAKPATMEPETFSRALSDLEALGFLVYGTSRAQVLVLMMHP